MPKLPDDISQKVSAANRQLDELLSNEPSVAEKIVIESLASEMRSATQTYEQDTRNASALERLSAALLHIIAKIRDMHSGIALTPKGRRRTRLVDSSLQDPYEGAILTPVIGHKDCYTIEIGDAGRGHGALSESVDLRSPSGDFCFVVRVGDNDRVRVCSERHGLSLIGHTSMTAGARVVYAGILHLSNGQLTQWTNESGHYKPSAALHHNIEEVLNPSLFQSKYADTAPSAFPPPPPPTRASAPPPPRLTDGGWASGHLSSRYYIPSGFDEPAQPLPTPMPVSAPTPASAPVPESAPLPLPRSLFDSPPPIPRPTGWVEGRNTRGIRSVPTLTKEGIPGDIVCPLCGPHRRTDAMHATEWSSRRVLRDIECKFCGAHV